MLTSRIEPKKFKSFRASSSWLYLHSVNEKREGEKGGGNNSTKKWTIPDLFLTEFGMVRTSEEEKEEEEEEERTYVRQKRKTREGGDGGKARHRHEGLHCTHAPKLSCTSPSLSLLFSPLLFPFRDGISLDEVC
jgi:hypothetical protein